MEKSMNATFGTSRRTTSEASIKSTSAPVSMSGPTRSDAADGPTTDPSGPQAFRANLSARQARERGLLTSGTSGQQANTSSASTDLASARTAVNTSTMGAAALVPADKPLTDRQRQFVKFWAEGDTIPNAMQRAGYNEQPSYGYRMAKMPNILVEFDRIKAKWEEAAQTSRQQVMEMHKEAFEMAKMMAEPATMVSAAREIGRMCGYYEPVKQRIEFTVNGQIAVKRLEAMSDEDLLRLVTEGLQAGQAAAQDQLALEDSSDITDIEDAP